MHLTRIILPRLPFASSIRLRQCSTASHDESASILVEKDMDITLIGINREHTRNSINAAAAEQLNKSLRNFESDDTSPVAVLYGVGGTFCAGPDLAELEQQLDENNYDFLLRKEGGVGPTRRHLRKPVVCAINGFCVASGLELALLCDLRVMEDTAVLGFFNRRFGAPITDGGTVRLAAAVGYSRAIDIIATGRRITGAEALEMGLINRLVATGTSLGQAVNLAFSIAKYPPISLQHDRTALHTSVYKEVKGGFRATIRSGLSNMSKDLLDEMQEGARRFKKSEKKGAKTHSWNIKEKPIPDWEREEIAHEERYAGEKLEKEAKSVETK